MAEIHDQLMLKGFKQLLREAQLRNASRQEIRRLEAAHEIMSSIEEDISFLHSGFCLAGLPHMRPEDDEARWIRSNGKFHLIITPGAIVTDGQMRVVGVPYGAKARLILVYLMSEGVKSQTVSLGPSMTAWIRSLGMPVTGGERGSIRAIREQALRISRCSFTFQWDNTEAQESIIHDQQLVDGGLHLWAAEEGGFFPRAVTLTAQFYDHLRNHAVPLDPRAIAYLKGSPLCLDLYVWLAHRLPRLSRPLDMPWHALAQQFGSAYRSTAAFAYRLKAVLPDVLTVYDGARVEVSLKGLTVYPSLPAVPASKSYLQGAARLLLAKAG
ncbi:MAG: plasmid replication protein [Proteobacteria bacterium]|nr:plasmid replication protein [Pseudomonadota bacterium]